MPDHALVIEPHDLETLAREIFGQEAALRHETAVAVGNRQLDFLDAHFEDIARLGAVDVNRAGENMTARPLVPHFVEYVLQRLLDLLGRQERPAQPLRTAGEQRLDLDRVARFDLEDRLGGGVEVAPDDSFRRGCERVRLWRGVRLCCEPHRNRAQDQHCQDGARFAHGVLVGRTWMARTHIWQTLCKPLTPCTQQPRAGITVCQVVYQLEYRSHNSKMILATY